jgi:Domain of unknown function (DUF4411)
MATHCFDTSAFIECWSGRYRRSTFPGLWAEIEAMVEHGEIVCPEEVLNEVKRKDDGLEGFIKENKANLVLPLDEGVMAETRTVLEAFPRLTGQARGRNKADPFVIATAKKDDLILVTEEGARGNQNRPKIPFVCNELEIPCINVLAFIEEQGWTF